MWDDRTCQGLFLHGQNCTSIPYQFPCELKILISIQRLLLLLRFTFVGLFTVMLKCPTFSSTMKGTSSSLTLDCQKISIKFLWSCNTSSSPTGPSSLTTTLLLRQSLETLRNSLSWHEIITALSWRWHLRSMKAHLIPLASTFGLLQLSFIVCCWEE